MKTNYIYLFISILFCCCTKTEFVIPSNNEPVDDIDTYLHISHTRDLNSKFLDSTVLTCSFDNFDMLWLGGDLTELTSESDASMMHVDSVFDVSNPNTLWSLGNHDHTNRPNVYKYTKREPYYSIYKDGMTILVLDTEKENSQISGEQLEYVYSILDTIENSSHCIILHHKLIWMLGDSILENQVNEISNADVGDCHYCLQQNNFFSDIYPSLIEVKNRDVNVICVGGDIGAKVKEFQHTTDDGIIFLASGIFSGHNENKVLKFRHNISKRILDWEYILLSELSQ